MARIWIVEDDPQIGLLIELTVKKAGHEARRLVDGVELERALQKDAPELLLLDLMLREKDGFTLLREWKQRQRTKDVPVIIISARGAERDKVRGLELDTDGKAQDADLLSGCTIAVENYRNAVLRACADAREMR